MRLLTLICAVAALAATAFACPVEAYCRGCVIETKVPELARAARAQALPVTIKASCHFEKQQRVENGRVRWRRVEICE